MIHTTLTVIRVVSQLYQSNLRVVSIRIHAYSILLLLFPKLHTRCNFQVVQSQLLTTRYFCHLSEDRSPSSHLPNHSDRGERGMDLASGSVRYVPTNSPHPPRIYVITPFLSSPFFFYWPICYTPPICTINPFNIYYDSDYLATPFLSFQFYYRSTFFYALLPRLFCLKDPRHIMREYHVITSCIYGRNST